METEEEVDILMSSDVYSATLSTKSISFSRSQMGWLFREDKTVGLTGGERGADDASNVRIGHRSRAKDLISPSFARLSV